MKIRLKSRRELFDLTINEDVIYYYSRSLKYLYFAFKTINSIYFYFISFAFNL